MLAGNKPITTTTTTNKWTTLFGLIKLYRLSILVNAQTLNAQLFLILRIQIPINFDCICDQVLRVILFGRYQCAKSCHLDTVLSAGVTFIIYVAIYLP